MASAMPSGPEKMQALRLRKSSEECHPEVAPFLRDRKQQILRRYRFGKI
jgi:hypothetical protein